MSDAHRPPIPSALEHLIDGLSELGTVLGAAAQQAIPVVRARLIEAMAARDRGDPVASMSAIGAAMEQLAALADRLDPQEGAMMRAVASHFQTALMRADLPEMKQGLDVMFDRSGARVRGKDR